MTGQRGLQWFEDGTIQKSLGDVDYAPYGRVIFHNGMHYHDSDPPDDYSPWYEKVPVIGPAYYWLVLIWPYRFHRWLLRNFGSCTYKNNGCKKRPVWHYPGGLGCRSCDDCCREGCSCWIDHDENGNEFFIRDDDGRHLPCCDWIRL